MFRDFFVLDHMFTPIAVVKRIRSTGLHSTVTYRTLHIFGLRVAYWTVGE